MCLESCLFWGAAASASGVLFGTQHLGFAILIQKCGHVLPLVLLCPSHSFLSFITWCKLPPVPGMPLLNRALKGIQERWIDTCDYYYFYYKASSWKQWKWNVSYLPPLALGTLDEWKPWTCPNVLPPHAGLVLPQFFKLISVLNLHSHPGLAIQTLHLALILRKNEPDKLEILMSKDQIF